MPPGKQEAEQVWQIDVKSKCGILWPSVLWYLSVFASLSCIYICAYKLHIKLMHKLCTNTHVLTLTHVYLLCQAKCKAMTISSVKIFSLKCFYFKPFDWSIIKNAGMQVRKTTAGRTKLKQKEKKCSRHG